MHVSGFYTQFKVDIKNEKAQNRKSKISHLKGSNTYTKLPNTSFLYSSFSLFNIHHSFNCIDDWSFVADIIDRKAKRCF